MSGLVLDASAALALLLRGDGGKTVRAVVRDRIVAGDRILVPTLFWLQAIDRLSARRLAPPTVLEAVYELDQLGIETAEVGRPGVLAVVDAVGRGLSVEQAAYLVLAESSDARLLTADPVLAMVAGDRAMLVGRRRPTGRTRRPDRSWARWRGAVAYLRELRSSL